MSTTFRLWQTRALLCHHIWCSYSRRHRIWNNPSVFSAECQMKCRTWKNKDTESSWNTENWYIVKAVWALDGKCLYFLNLPMFTEPYSNTIVLWDLIYSLTYTTNKFWPWIESRMSASAFSLTVVLCLLCCFQQLGHTENKETLWMDGEYVTWHDPCEKHHTPWGRSSTTKPCCPFVVQTPPIMHKTRQIWTILTIIIITQHPFFCVYERSLKLFDNSVKKKQWHNLKRIVYIWIC